MADEKRFTRAELAAYDGQEGRPAYVAYKGRVVDVTASRMWRGGSHMKRHAAGQDLTEEIASAPHDVDVLDRFPQVGVLVEEPAPGAVPAHGHAPMMARSLPVFLQRFLKRHPFFLRHPHPMTVHFPIAFFIAVPVFTALFLVTGRSIFETTALNCLGAALLFSLVVIPTGLLSWWINYGAQRIRAVTVKIVLSLAQFAAGLAAFLWRLLDPQVAHHGDAPAVLYLLLLFLLLPMIVVVAWYGATLTFPLRRDKSQWRRRNADR
jgi:predicted heme/steroid binding protein/uncharacterized membrane protein